MPFCSLLARAETEPDGALRRVGGTGAPASLLCGVYRFDAGGPHPLLRSLLPLVHVPALPVRTDRRLARVVELLAAEVVDAGPGAAVVVDRLVDVLFVHVLRTWLEREPDGCTTGWLRSLADREVGLALTRIHGDSSRPWTVQTLAAEVGLSRAAFARRFSALVGEPSLGYLTRWRLTLAADLLDRTDQPLSSVATRVGYASGFALSRAFSRAHGESPSVFRARRQSVVRPPSLHGQRGTPTAPPTRAHSKRSAGSIALDIQ